MCKRTVITLLACFCVQTISSPGLANQANEKYMLCTSDEKKTPLVAIFENSNFDYVEIFFADKDGYRADKHPRYWQFAKNDPWARNYTATKSESPEAIYYKSIQGQLSAKYRKSDTTLLFAGELVPKCNMVETLQHQPSE